MQLVSSGSNMILLNIRVGYCVLAECHRQKLSLEGGMACMWAGHASLLLTSSDAAACIAQCLDCFWTYILCHTRLGNKPCSAVEAVDQTDIVVWIQVDPVRRVFDILRKEGCRYVAPDDLKSMMAGILLSHPGLEFLQETPEFQDRYTCIAHI